jgi:hypothetical protein
MASVLVLEMLKRQGVGVKVTNPEVGEDLCHQCYSVPEDPEDVLHERVGIVAAHLIALHYFGALLQNREHSQ